jgi:hypothetical protein
MAGRRHEGIVDHDHRERTDRAAFRLQLVELGNLLFQRAAGERHAKSALAEGAGAFPFSAFGTQSLRARVLALLVAPDAIIRFIQRARKVGPRVREPEALAPPQFALQAIPLEALRFIRHHRNEAPGIGLVGCLEEYACRVHFLALRS